MVKISKNTKIKIFYDRIGEKRYLAFDLFIYPAFNILKNNFDNINFINNFNQFDCNDNDILLIMYLNDLGKYIKRFGYKMKNNIRIIFIHADFLYNHSKNDQNEIINFVNIINHDKCSIWEYSSQNIYYFNKFYKNINYYFLPLLYHPFIENLYNSKLINGKIPWEKKDIDIVFLGDYSKRRQLYYEKIKKKYNTYIITGINNYSEIFNIIERGKIFVNLYSKDTSKPFDYYKLALLYSNNIFTITEIPKVDFNIEKNLLDLKDLIITCSTNNYMDIIEKYIRLTGDEITEINSKIYDNFKKYTLENYISDFFEI